MKQVSQFLLTATIIGMCTPALMQAGLTQSPDTVVDQGSGGGREHRGGHFPLDGNR